MRAIVNKRWYGELRARVRERKKPGMFIMPELNTGDWARTVRVARKMSQSELASRCGVSSREVNMFEKNEPVTAEVKLRLLHELWANRAGGAG
jgi:DNA-binding transcriptional regulator YiaG